MPRSQGTTGVLKVSQYNAIRQHLQDGAPSSSHASKIPATIYGGGRLQWSDFSILQPDPNLPTITREAARKSMSALHIYLQQMSPLTRNAANGWILLCPPDVSEFVVEVVHLLQACAGRDKVIHNIGNLSDPFVMETIRKCPLCVLNKRAKTVKTITAIRADENLREESWDYSDSNEGQLIKVLSHYLPPQKSFFRLVRVQIIANVYHVNIVFIPPRDPAANGRIERAHAPHHARVRSLLLQHPNLHPFEAHLMSVNIANKLVYTPTGVSPFQYRYGRAPSTMLATTLVEQPSPSLDDNAPAAAAVASLDAPRMVSIEDRMALTHAVRQEAQAHQTRYQDRYDGKQIGKSCKLELGDAVLLRHTAPDRAAITTSKLLGFANTGPYILAEFVGKTSARLRDALWGETLTDRVPLNRLSLFRRRGTTPVPQFEDILRIQDKPKLDSAYAAQQSRLLELQSDLASRPDAPVCTSCKKKVDCLHAKHMCKPCYTKFANNRAKANRQEGAPPRPRGRPRKGA
ncbi:hypothetical protein CYMTET_4325 [Cymbomonas tetramitiformis]|uniref:Uncharacterized protein n=1 Tax=Cymbomonas tetramitiformis TaxID=36881 RepID=A0AAE0H1E2_9CHLO|nr:hypothetical protein CYMTET_4325 [Cymbomonas tetramitiformis]